MYSTLLSDAFFSPVRTVYVVSDSQLEEIKVKQRREELEKLESSRKNLESSYKSRVKILDERENELREELKNLLPKVKDEIKS